MGSNKPAVKNGALLTLVKGIAVKHVPFNGPQPNFCTIDGVPIVTEGIQPEGSLVGGLPFTVTNPATGLSTAATINGNRVVLLGADVLDSDGFHGPVESQHVTATDQLIG